MAREAAWRARQEQRRVRVEFARARRLGLAARHAAKLERVHEACTVADDGRVCCVVQPAFASLCPRQPAAVQPPTPRSSAPLRPAAAPPAPPPPPPPPPPAGTPPPAAAPGRAGAPRGGAAGAAPPPPPPAAPPPAPPPHAPTRHDRTRHDGSRDGDDGDGTRDGD